MLHTTSCSSCNTRSSVCLSLSLAGHLQDSPCHTAQSSGTLSSLRACMQSSTFPLQLLLGLRSWPGSSVALKVCAGPTLGMLKCTFFSGRLDQAIGCFHTHLRKSGLFPLISPLLLPPFLAKLRAFIVISHKYEFGLINFLTKRST